MKLENQVCKEKEQYPQVLDAKLIQQILDIGERQTYELLNSNQFHTVRVGRMIKVSKMFSLNGLRDKK